MITNGDKVELNALVRPGVNLMEQCAASACASLYGQLDHVIRTILTSRWGNNWSMDDIRRDCHWEVYPRIRYLLIRDKRVLEVYEPESELARNGDGSWTYIVKQNYALL